MGASEMGAPETVGSSRGLTEDLAAYPPIPVVETVGAR